MDNFLYIYISKLDSATRCGKHITSRKVSSASQSSTYQMMMLCPHDTCKPDVNGCVSGALGFSYWQSLNIGLMHEPCWVQHQIKSFLLYDVEGWGGLCTILRKWFFGCNVKSHPYNTVAAVGKLGMLSRKRSEQHIVLAQSTTSPRKGRCNHFV